MIGISINDEPVDIDDNDKITMKVTVKVTSEELISKTTDWTLYCELRINHTEKLHIYNQSSNNRFVKPLNDTFKFNVSFAPQRRIEDDDIALPRYLYAEINSRGQKIFQAEIQLNSVNFIKTIRNSNFNQNIIVLGLNGSGKSSLCNTLATAISPSKYAIYPTLAITSESHVTQCIEYVPLFSINPCVTKTLVNTPGFYNAKAEDLDKWIKGDYEDGTQLVVKKELRKGKSGHHNPLCTSNYAIIVIEWDANTIKKSIRDAAKLFENSSLTMKVVVFTHKDKIRNMVDMDTAKEECVNQGLVDDKGKVFFIKNYFDSNIRDPETDFTSLEILRCLNQLNMDDSLEFDISKLQELKIPGLDLFKRNNIDPNDSLYTLMHIDPETKINISDNDTWEPYVAMKLKEFSFSINKSDNMIIADLKSQKHLIEEKLQKNSFNISFNIYKDNGELAEDTDSLFSVINKSSGTCYILIGDVKDKGKDANKNSARANEGTICETRRGVIVCYFDPISKSETNLYPKPMYDSIDMITEKIRNDGYVLVDKFGKETMNLKKSTFFEPDKIMRLRVSKTKKASPTQELPVSEEKNVEDRKEHQQPSVTSPADHKHYIFCDIQEEKGEGLSAKTVLLQSTTIEKAQNELHGLGYRIVDESGVEVQDISKACAPTSEDIHIRVKRRYYAFDPYSGVNGTIVQLPQTSTLSDYLVALRYHGFRFLTREGQTTESVAEALEERDGTLVVRVTH